jgi:Uma2 family endonuclease
LFFLAVRPARIVPCGIIGHDTKEKETAVRIKTHATIEDLYKVEGKAELVNGEIVCMSPTGGVPGRAGGKVYVSLLQYEQQHSNGYAFPDNVGFIVHLPHRESFSPDVAWYVGELRGGEFLEGAPVFAVEVRSKYDYGRRAERTMQAKRDDYFACGTLVIGDMDALREQVIRVYRASDPDKPTIYRKGDIADAEPAVPGWRIPVNDLFE